MYRIKVYSILDNGEKSCERWLTKNNHLSIYKTRAMVFSDIKQACDTIMRIEFTGAFCLLVNY